MSSTEYNRRHYGIAADEPIAPRLSVPSNIGRRTSEITGIYETRSPAVPVSADPKPTPPLISLIPTKIDVAELDAWATGTTSLRASGTKIVRPADIMIIPKETKNIPLVVNESGATE